MNTNAWTFVLPWSLLSLALVHTFHTVVNSSDNDLELVSFSDHQGNTDWIFWKHGSLQVKTFCNEFFESFATSLHTSLVYFGLATKWKSKLVNFSGDRYWWQVRWVTIEYNESRDNVGAFSRLHENWRGRNRMVFSSEVWPKSRCV